MCYCIGINSTSLHLIVDDVEHNNTDIQVSYLQLMLFLYNVRCILLPLVICSITCDRLKQWFYELLTLCPYIDENDLHKTMIDQFTSFSSSSQTFAKPNHDEHFDM